MRRPNKKAIAKKIAEEEAKRKKAEERRAKTSRWFFWRKAEKVKVAKLDEQGTYARCIIFVLVYARTGKCFVLE